MGRPKLALCRPPLLTVMTLLRTTGAALSMLARDWGAFLGSAVSGTFGPPLHGLLSAARAVKEFLVPVLKVQDSSCPADKLCFVATPHRRLCGLHFHSAQELPMSVGCALPLLFL